MHLYPEPMYDTIIEPFAGSARYALRYGARSDRNVILNDLDPTIYGIWKWLVEEATPERIAVMPKIREGDRIGSKKFSHLSQAERDLIGFSVEIGKPRPHTKPIRSRALVTGVRRPYDRFGVVKRQMRRLCPLIRQWQVHKVPYEELPNVRATWFIDPPYCGTPGRTYRHNKIDYEHLAEWCRTRKGQVIVCEGAGAHWLPFRSLGTTANGSMRSLSVEKVWTNIKPTPLFDRLCGAPATFDAQDW